MRKYKHYLFLSAALVLVAIIPWINHIHIYRTSFVQSGCGSGYIQCGASGWNERRDIFLGYQGIAFFVFAALIIVMSILAYKSWPKAGISSLKRK